MTFIDYLILIKFISFLTFDQLIKNKNCFGDLNIMYKNKKSVTLRVIADTNYTDSQYIIVQKIWTKCIVDRH